MKRFAFGPLGLKPDEFWNLTFLEIEEMIEAYQEKMDITRHLVAWHAANVMNVHTKKHITVDKLLGKKKEMTTIDREAEIEKLRQALKERRDRHG